MATTGAPTRDVTRTNPTAVTIDTLQKTAQVSIFKAVLSGADNAVALDAANAAKVTDELGSTCMMVQVEDGGLEILMVGDAHANTIASVARRIGHILDTAAASATQVAGVYTCGGGGTVTVTEPTDLFDL